MKILLVKVKNLCTSACLSLNYGAVKQEPKMVGFIKTCDLSLILLNFSALQENCTRGFESEIYIKI